jgi:hypothetical protein
MIVKLHNDTYRVQFIKAVEKWKRGKTTIQTICKIFKWGEKPEGGKTTGESRSGKRITENSQKSRLPVTPQNRITPPPTKPPKQGGK